jgi:hypothetical protein
LPVNEQTALKLFHENRSALPLFLVEAVSDYDQSDGEGQSAEKMGGAFMNSF